MSSIVILTAAMQGQEGGGENVTLNSGTAVTLFANGAAVLMNGTLEFANGGKISGMVYHYFGKCAVERREGKTFYRVTLVDWTSGQSADSATVRSTERVHLDGCCVELLVQQGISAVKLTECSGLHEPLKFDRLDINAAVDW
eukprot:TRINITY_DN2677_c0_g1_i2.p2 TRINITY_DN2677_c0_g1~~TRINITY_DN2677_c0_g1_i2.p2  ORF type:complete len:142 (+),score=27.76 TRINITY_DN2677_c0_g1_i2:240-665(+)